MPDCLPLKGFWLMLPVSKLLDALQREHEKDHLILVKRRGL